MKTKTTLTSVLFFASLLSVGQANAGHLHCDICRKGCVEYKLVAKKVRVPCTVIETQMKSRVVCTPEEREETYTEFKRTPVTKEYQKESCYLDPEVKTKQITTKECKLIPTPISKTYAVNVPSSEMREVRRGNSCCADCCPEKPCLKCVIRLTREKRTGTIERDQLVFEETTKDIYYCVEMPKTKKEFCFSETYDKLEPVKKTRKVTVCVPKIVKEPVEVEVVKMLPKIIYCCEACNQKPQSELMAKVQALHAKHAETHAKHAATHAKKQGKRQEKREERREAKKQ